MKKGTTLQRPDPYAAPELYDYEYRRRREDVWFYRTLAEERGGPILDLGCGTGRLFVPLLRDGHTVVGIDRATPMLARAYRRLTRLRSSVRQRGLLVRCDLTRFAFRRPFLFAIAAFHTIQHLTTDAELLLFLRATHSALQRGGWLAFDVFAPEDRFLRRDPARRWDRTVFRHPLGGERLIYTESHEYRPRSRTLHMRFHYRRKGGRAPPPYVAAEVDLCHRQLTPDEVRALLDQSGFSLIASYGGFDGRPIDPKTEQHIYLAQAR
jgi:SAM-dependent methyltransferase